MSDCGAEAGGDELLLDEVGVGDWLVDRCIGFIGCEGLEHDGFWGFDHKESGDQSTEGIFNLLGNVSSWR